MHPLYFNSHTPKQTRKEELLTHESITYAKMLVGAGPDDQCFLFSSHKETLATLFLSIWDTESQEEGKNHFIISRTEPRTIHHIFQTFKRWHCSIEHPPIHHEQLIDLEALETLFNPKTALCSISYANTVTGTIQPIEQIAACCQKHHVLFHSDLSASIGKIAFSQLPADFCTFDGSFLGLPTGLSFLFVKKGIPFHPIFSSDQSISLKEPLRQEAVAILKNAHDEIPLYMTEAARLTSLLTKKLRKIDQIDVFSAQAMKLPHYVLFGVKGVFGELLAYLLQKKNCFITRGGDEWQWLDQQLAECGLSIHQARTAISLTLTPHTSQSDIDELLERLDQIMQRLTKVRL